MSALRNPLVPTNGISLEVLIFCRVTHSRVSLSEVDYRAEMTCVYVPPGPSSASRSSAQGSSCVRRHALQGWAVRTGNNRLGRLTGAFPKRGTHRPTLCQYHGLQPDQFPRNPLRWTGWTDLYAG